MAKQVGNIVMLGTIEDLCFYEMDGQYYIRCNPGPSRKEFLQSPKYKTQREAGERMWLSARLASAIYKHLPSNRWLYYALQKLANNYFKEGSTQEEVTDRLTGYLVSEGHISSLKASAITEHIKHNQLNKLNQPISQSPRKHPDHYTGVRLRTKEGRWNRLYHEDELELLDEYADEMQEHDLWLTDFLVKRKQLPSYRLKHKRKRRTKTIAKQPAFVAVVKTIDKPVSPQQKTPVRKRRTRRICTDQTGFNCLTCSFQYTDAPLIFSTPISYDQNLSLHSLRTYSSHCFCPKSRGTPTRYRYGHAGQPQ